MTTRRDVLKIGLGGWLASTFSARGEEPKGAGTIFASVTDLEVGPAKMNGYLAIDADTGTWRSFLPDEQNRTARISPDGRTIVYRKLNDKRLWLAEISGEHDPRPLAEIEGRPFWAPDGRSLVVSSPGEGIWRIKADGSGREKLPFRDEDSVFDVSPDGRWFVVQSDRGDHRGGGDRVPDARYAVKADGTGWTLLTTNAEATCWQHRIATDGRSVLYLSATDEECGLWSIARDGSDRRLLIAEREDEAPFQACGSPDGSKMAVVLFDRTKNDDGKKNDIIRDCRLEITDSSGKAGKKLPLPTSKVLFLLGWHS